MDVWEAWRGKFIEVYAVDLGPVRGCPGPRFALTENSKTKAFGAPYGNQRVDVCPHTAEID